MMFYMGVNSLVTSYSKGRKTLGLRSFVANFSQAFMRPLVRRWYDSHSQVKRTDPCLTF